MKNLTPMELLTYAHTKFCEMLLSPEEYPLDQEEREEIGNLCDNLFSAIKENEESAKKHDTLVFKFDKGTGQLLTSCYNGTEIDQSLHTLDQCDYKQGKKICRAIDVLNDL